jgi:acetyl esterase
MPRPRERYVAGADPTDPDLSPLLAPELRWLARAVLCVAEDDVLRAQGLAYAERLRSAGVPARVVDGHGARPRLARVGMFARRPAEAIAEFGAAVRELLGR